MYFIWEWLQSLYLDFENHLALLKDENWKAELICMLETTHCIWVKVPIWAHDLEPILFTTHSMSKGNGNSPWLAVPRLYLCYIFHGLASDFEKDWLLKKVEKATMIWEWDKSINILNMEQLGMIRLELHLSLKKELMSMLQSQMPLTIQHKFTMWKYSWSQIKN